MDIKKRWKTNSGISFIEELNNVLSKGGEIKTSPFGLFEGLKDLRGMTFNDEINVNKFKLSDIDYSSSTFKNCKFSENIISNCIFNGANLSKMVDVGNKFTNCSFLKSSFNSAIIGYEGTSFKNCVFAEVSFKKTSFIRAEFTNCKFINCDLDNVDFNASSFVDCEFIGKIRDIWFRGEYKFKQDIKNFGKPIRNKMKNVSFKDAELILPIFSNNCNLDTVEIPTNGNYIKINDWSKFLISLNKNDNNLSEKNKIELGIYIKVNSVHAKNQKSTIIDYSGISEEFGQDVADYIFEKAKIFI